MGRLEKFIVGKTEIIRIDYEDCDQAEMIDLVQKTKELILREGQPVVMLCQFHERNRLTPRFMRQLESDYKEVENLITKNAVMGLSNIQRWILKGMNMWTKREIIHFESEEEAITYLIERR